MAEALEQAFGTMRLTETVNLSTGPCGKPDSYVLTMDRSPGMPVFAAATSDFTIGVYSADNLALLNTITAHTDVVSSVRFSLQEPHLLFTAAQDNSLYSWDVRDKCSTPVMTFTGLTKAHYLSMDVDPRGRLVCGGTEQNAAGDAHILFWDLRSTKLLGAYEESHENDVTFLCFCPSKTDVLASGGADGLVNVFDVSQENEDDALLQILNCENVVSRVGWCGQDHKDVYCVTDFNSLHVWDALEGDEVSNVPRDALPKSCDYLLDCLQHDSAQDKLLVLAGTDGGGLEVLEVTDNALHNVSQLKSPGAQRHSDTVRCALWHKPTATLLSGGEDGMICKWTSVAPKPLAHKTRSKTRREKTRAKTQPY